MERVSDILRPEDDVKWEIIQFRTTPELKRDFNVWIKKHGLTISVYLRMVMMKTLENDLVVKDMRTIRPIENAVEEVQEMLPVYTKYGNQRRY